MFSVLKYSNIYIPSALVENLGIYRRRRRRHFCQLYRERERERFRHLCEI
jgi:hypothetical protein